MSYARVRKVKIDDGKVLMGYTMSNDGRGYYEHYMGGLTETYQKLGKERLFLELLKCDYFVWLKSGNKFVKTLLAAEKKIHEKIKEKTYSDYESYAKELERIRKDVVRQYCQEL